MLSDMQGAKEKQKGLWCAWCLAEDPFITQTSPKSFLVECAKECGYQIRISRRELEERLDTAEDEE